MRMGGESFRGINSMKKFKAHLGQQRTPPREGKNPIKKKRCCWEKVTQKRTPKLKKFAGEMYRWRQESWSTPAFPESIS